VAVSGGQALFLFDEKRALMRTIPVGEPVFALGVFSGTGGNVIYCGLIDRVTVFSLQGRLLDEWISLGERARISSLAVSEDVVYVGDAGTKHIAVFDHNGKLLRFIGLRTADDKGFLIPGICFDIAVGEGAVLWAVDPGRLRIVQLSGRGDILFSWGKAEPTVEGFSGCCNPAQMALFSDGRFVVQEKGLRRIKLYDQRGRFRGVVAGPRSFHSSLSLMDLAAAANGDVYVVDTFRKAVRIFSPREDVP
jgi:hypothetical protein